MSCPTLTSQTREWSINLRLSETKEMDGNCVSLGILLNGVKPEEQD
jgi:hypothetical protein